jgi:hypothetical protein
VPSLGSTVAFDALAAGDLDAYVDYSGTIWATVMHRSDPGERRGDVLAEVERYLADQRGITVAAALGFENRYALAMRADRARELGVARIGELARHAPELEIGGDYEFFARAEWRALVAAYGLAFRAQRAMDPSLLYTAVRERQVDAISAYSTDGRIAAENLLVLDDERRVIPPYDAIVLASGRLAREHPEALAALRELAGAIDAVAMRAHERRGRRRRPLAGRGRARVPGPEPLAQLDHRVRDHLDAALDALRLEQDPLRAVLPVVDPVGLTRIPRSREARLVARHLRDVAAERIVDDRLARDPYEQSPWMIGLSKPPSFAKSGSAWSGFLSPESR